MVAESSLVFLSITQLSALLRKKKLSPVELTQAFLGRINKLNPALNAYLTVVPETALEQARKAEREILRGKYRGPLHGIPISLKDNIYTAGVRTTGGSKFLAQFVPAYDAAVALRLGQAGAVLLGKTNLHEFAYGVTTDNPHFGPTRNPWDVSRIPGGSSGGSAAAIAAGMCCASIGSDTGGSIRIPAALCGIVGLKPQFGRVSCHGVIPLSRSLDHAGPLARTVADAAILLGVIAGGDPLDPSTLGLPALRMPATSRLFARRPKKLRLGWPREYFFDRLDNEVKRAVEAAAADFRKLGANLVEVSLPGVHGSTDPSTHMALAEARSFHETAGYYPSHAADYGEDVRKRLEMATDIRAVDYLNALEAQKRARSEFESVLEGADAILAPTVPVPAPPIATKLLNIAGEEEPVRAALLRLNRPANFTGLPAISVPCGFTGNGLPIGLQIIGRPFGELELLRIAHLYEQGQPWHTMHPSDAVG